MSVYSDPWLTIHGGDCRAVMASMEPESVHCVVTSPPYWGLRDYGTATWVGGDEACDHKPEFKPRSERPNVTGSGMGSGYKGQEPAFRDTCGKCGAVRQDAQLGLEPTPEAYVESMVAVFREVRRVLRSDGTVWLNLGDSYANDGKWGGSSGGKHVAALHGQTGIGRQKVQTGLKPKDLVGIPWRVAFALQADGWYLRSDIIWSKPNPMPESVTDRPTKAHEYVFLLSKSPRYYFDADAVREPHQPSTLNRIEYGLTHRHPDGIGVGIPPVDTERMGERFANPAGRNIRSVWNIATQPYPGAHFAVFPEKLVEPCVLAGCPSKACRECGAPWERIIERIGGPPPGDHRKRSDFQDQHKQAHASGTVDGASLSDVYKKYGYAEIRTTGWRPTCAHDVDTVAGTVLDPFGGSGTTARVANRLGRRAVLIDLNPEYLEQQMKRAVEGVGLPLGLDVA